jgi:DNA-binding transcriptional LysR family regulator
MLRRGLPLNALRVFEAAARLHNFSRAADELGVTQTAVSRQIRLLEGYLGVPLFVRRHNGLVLTDQGAEYHRMVRDGLTQLYEGSEKIRGTIQETTVRLNVLPNFAMRWLIPRLHEFRDAYPKIIVRLITSQPDLDFSTGAFDIAIRFGLSWPNCRTDLLFAADLFPVCSPKLAAHMQAPESLRQQTLLHVSQAPDDWSIWLSGAEVSDVDVSRGLTFDSYALALEAAIHDLGVAVARGPFVADDLIAGRLVAPFSLKVTQEVGWYLVYQQAVADNPGVKPFRRWILDAAVRTKRDLD